MQIKQRKQHSRWLAVGGATLGIVGAGLAVHNFLPLRLKAPIAVKREKTALVDGSLPDVEVTFLALCQRQGAASLVVRAKCTSPSALA